MARLGDVCAKITDGSHNPPQGISCSEYLMLSSKNIYDDDISFDDPRYLSKENYETENKRTQISVGDILLTIVGSVGRAAVVSKTEKKICLQRSVAVIKPKQELINSRFLMYQLQSMRTHLEQEARGVAQKGIYLKQVENLQIKVPSRGEQLQVVSNLDQISELISFRKRQLAKLDELVKARFVELFGDPVANEKGWETLSLEQACNSIVDCPHSTPKYTFENTGYMCIRTSIVKKNKLLWDKIEYISEEEYIQRIQRKKPEKGDIVYTREGAILGIAAIIDRECNVALGQRSMLLSPDKSTCVSEFLCVAMNFESFLDNALKGISGSASPHINVGDIKSFNMIMPPIVLQNQFAALVEQTNKSKLAIQQSLDKLETLKKSLMQKYFG